MAGPSAAGNAFLRGGIEFPLLVWASSVALAATGGLRFSLDAWLGWADNLSGLWWGVGVAVVGVLVSLVTLGLGRHAPVRVSEPSEEEVPARRAA
jgi:hypothetical protein